MDSGIHHKNTLVFSMQTWCKVMLKYEAILRVKSVRVMAMGGGQSYVWVIA